AGRREVLWCTRYPVNTRIEPSSIRVGMATSSVRRGLRSTSWTPGSRSMILAASSSCCRADSQADPELTADYSTLRSWRWDSNPRPSDYKSLALPGCATPASGHGTPRPGSATANVERRHVAASHLHALPPEPPGL